MEADVLMSSPICNKSTDVTTKLSHERIKGFNSLILWISKSRMQMTEKHHISPFENISIKWLASKSYELLKQNATSLFKICIN